ncbi:MAG: T9SS type A sorting domain-containing protein [Crocinitomicaceae bacterium]
MKNKTLKISLLLCFVAIFSTNLSFSQVVFTEDFTPSNSCTSLANAFYLGCLPDWISTSGSPSINTGSIIPFNGDYAHGYIKARDDFSGPTEQRSESIALNNFTFMQGVTYKITYRVQINANLHPSKYHHAEWVLTNGLQNQTGGYLSPQELLPPLPANQIINSPVNSTSGTWVTNTHEFTPNANYGQLTFRNYIFYTNAHGGVTTGDWYLDDFRIEILCPIITDDEYYSCGEDFPTICPIGTDANTTWAYNAGTTMNLVHTGACFTPTQPGDYVLVNSGECYSTTTFTIIDTCAPCNADFELQIFNQGNGMYGITPLLTDPSVSFVYMEVLQNGGVVAQSSTPSSFVLPAGSYTICIVVRNNWTGEVCQYCQDFCIGETTDFEWDGIERASEWERESESRSNEIQSEVKSEEFKGKQLEKYLKPIITPNPSNGEFVISSLKTKTKMVAIEVYDMNSKLVYSLNSIQNKNRVSVDLKDQQSGIYIVKIVNSDGSMNHQKVVVGK